MSEFNQTVGMTRLIRAFGYSLQGFAACFRHEAAFRLEVMLSVFIVPLGFWLGASGVTDIVLSLGYRPEAFTEACALPGPDADLRSLGLDQGLVLFTNQFQRLAVDAEGAPVEGAAALKAALITALIDREDGAWVGMPRAKALEHALDGARVEMLRGGERSCVRPALFDEDRETVRAIHVRKVGKYAVARLAGAIGLYPLEAGEGSVALRLDPCPSR